MKQRATGIVLAAVAAGWACSPAGADPAGPAGRAGELLKASGVTGGLVVHVGCGDGRLTRQLRAGPGYLVHGLSLRAGDVAAARRGLPAGPDAAAVRFARFDGRRLPYVDNLVNLLVAERLGDVPMAEVLRVLAPGGVAMLAGRKVVKPRPESLDDWTHYLHDATNNAVAHDTAVGPPRHLQWQCGPRWSRHHDHMASVSAMVSAGGRVFYILDEGSRVSPQLPPRWRLVGRDAFNGVLLWKRTIADWHPALWPLKSGPANLPRRLVAGADHLYATLALAGPVEALDAATGRTVRTYAGSDGAEEILLSDGVLLVLVNRTPLDLDADRRGDSEAGRSRDHRTTFSPYMSRIWSGVRSKRWAHGRRAVLAYAPADGRLLWKRQGPVLPLTLAADGRRAYFHDGERIVAVELRSGRAAWTSGPAPVWRGLEGGGLQSWFAPTLVVADGKVLWAGGEKMHMSYVGWGAKDIGQDTMTAYSAETGRKLWTAEHPYSGYNSPEDLFFAAGRVWAGKTAKGGDGRYVGHDPATGKPVSDFPPTVRTFWFHHRCHRAKATDRYILCSRTGIEFVDLQTGRWSIHHWVRGVCLYGIMPCNGMVYCPPHPCACYPESKLNGFVALAAATATRAVPKRPDPGRLEKGPGAEDAPAAPAPGAAGGPAGAGRTDWPTYRGDPARSGAARSAVPTKLRRRWRLPLGGRLTQAVAAGGRLFVADADAGLVHAVDAAAGRLLWSYRAGGRVDSPPTCWGPLVLFGSADGYVAALRAADGAVAWRFRAAPTDRRLVAFEQVESVWPVHGSVLVTAGTRPGEAVVTCVAGRSRFLDGGLRLCRLDARSGTLLSETVLGATDRADGADLQGRINGLNMPVALPDILSSDGKHLFMRSAAMDLTGDGEPGRVRVGHLFAAYGFLDDSWFHRTYWLFGEDFRGGVGGFGNGRKRPAGLILAFDDRSVYGYGRKAEYYRWCSAVRYHLFAAARPGDAGGATGEKAAAARRRGKGRGKGATVAFRWSRELPIMARAMVLAGPTLFVAGPVNLLDEVEAFQHYDEPRTQKALAEQDAALAGRRGARLLAVAAGDGATAAEYVLDAPPVFDGLSAAGGRLYAALTDGALECWAAP